LPALVTYDGLVKRYGAITAVDGLSFEVPEGSVVGLLGPNGAGKTTAIRVLLGLGTPTEGSTSLFGAKPGTPAFPGAVRLTGSMIEGPALYARATARQNLDIEVAALGVERTRRQIDDLLTLVGLLDRADTAAGQFSLGMKQRLGLAIALVGGPRIVVLDEPTNGLDPAGIVEIRKLIASLPDHGTTVLVSSHLLAEVQLMCDRAAIINRGKLVADGTIDELLARGGSSSGFAVRVAPQLVEKAVGRLIGSGLDVVATADGSIQVGGDVVDGSQISQALAEEGVYVSELRRLEASLEDVFMSLTGGQSGDAG
jgi:ABC-2 type transport system ATP-binding protein